MNEPSASDHLTVVRTVASAEALPYVEAALAKVSVAVAALETIRDRQECVSTTPCNTSNRGTACAACQTHLDAVRALDALTPNTPTKEQP